MGILMLTGHLPHTAGHSGAAEATDQPSTSGRERLADSHGHSILLATEGEDTIASLVTGEQQQQQLCRYSLASTPTAWRLRLSLLALHACGKQCSYVLSSMPTQVPAAPNPRGNPASHCHAVCLCPPMQAAAGLGQWMSSGSQAAALWRL